MTRDFVTKNLKVSEIKTATESVIENRHEVTQTEKSTTTATKDTTMIKEEIKKTEIIDVRCVCIRTAFRPLGIVAKFFGLFPCYNLSFKEDLKNYTGCPIRVKIWQAMEYMYSFLILLLMTGGSILCYLLPPTTIRDMRDVGNEETDYLVVMSTLYGQLIMGAWSLFIFPRHFCRLIHFIEHFVHVDKILHFSRSFQEKEQYAGIIIVRVLFFWFISSALLYAGILLLETTSENSYTDYIMIGILTLSGMVHSIPTALLLFFLNGIQLRFRFFNDKMDKLVLPITPSCFSCVSYRDYADELNGQVCQRKCNTLAEDMEKMRILHEEISGLIDQTSNVFGSHILREYLFCIVGIIMYTYFIVVLQNDNGGIRLKYWYLYVGFDVFMIVKLLLISRFAHQVTTEGSASLRVLSKASLTQLTPDCSFQIQTFVRKLHNRRSVTADGYFVVDRSMMSSILGALTTYFIILVQFKVSNFSRELKELAKCS